MHKACAGKEYSSFEHQMQVAAYSLLMPERYNWSGSGWERMEAWTADAADGVHVVDALSCRPHGVHDSNARLVHESNGGLLFYMKTGVLKGVGCSAHEVATIIQHRNRLAAALVRKQLPSMLMSEHKCSRCFVNQTCALYHKVP
jgi:hypothetical protein